MPWLLRFAWNYVTWWQVLLGASVITAQLVEREEAHAAATAPNAWRCTVTGCPVAGVWHPADTRREAEASADGHYTANHYAPTT